MSSGFFKGVIDERPTGENKDKVRKRIWFSYETKQKQQIKTSCALFFYDKRIGHFTS